MRLRDLFISVSTILTLTTAPALAAPNGGPAKPGGPATTSTHGSPKTVASSSPKTTTSHGSSAATTHGSAKSTTTTHGTSKSTTTAAAGPKTTTTTSHGGSSHGGSKKATTTTSTGGSTSTSTTGSGTTTTTTQPNPIAQKISSKTQLNSKITAMLPKGMTLDEASKGFKNQGQFIAALHVSQNLGIPFADLKTAMTGIKPVTTTPKSTTSGGTTSGGTTTGTTTGGSTSGTSTTTSTTGTPLLSLGQAIHKLRPTADSTAEETRATTQMTADLGTK